MTGGFSYNTYNFREPEILSEETYLDLKKLDLDKYFNRISPQSSFQKFKIHLLVIGIGIVGNILSYTIEKIFGDNIVSTCMYVIFIMMLFPIVPLFMEFSSYENYISNHESYYSKMKSAIRISTDYNDFCYLFYLASVQDFNERVFRWNSDKISQ